MALRAPQARPDRSGIGRGPRGGAVPDGDPFACASGRTAGPWRGAGAPIGTAALALALGGGGIAAPAQAAVGEVLTAAQRDWLAAREPPRFGVEADYPPFIFAGAGGEPEGLSVDMLALVRARTGLAIAPQAPAPLHRLLEDLRQGRLDMVSSLRPTPERGEFLTFTAPYVTVPAALIVRAGAGEPTLAGLTGQPVAVGQGYAAEAAMRARHPRVAWQPVADDAVALRGVAEGRFAAAVVDLASAAHIARRDGHDGLRSAGPVGFEYRLSFAVRKDLPVLAEVLERGVRAVPAAERQALLDRWIPPLDGPLGRPSGHWAGTLGLGLLLLAAVFGAVMWRRAGVRRSAVDSGPPA